MSAGVRIPRSRDADQAAARQAGGIVQRENNPSWDTSIPGQPLVNLNGADGLCNKVSEMHHYKHLRGAIDNRFLTIQGLPNGGIFLFYRAIELNSEASFLQLSNRHCNGCLWGHFVESVASHCGLSGSFDLHGLAWSSRTIQSHIHTAV